MFDVSSPLQLLSILYSVSNDAPLMYKQSGTMQALIESR